MKDARPSRCLAPLERLRAASRRRNGSRHDRVHLRLHLVGDERYVAPIELYLKKAGLTSSIATFPGDGEGQCFVSDLPAEQVVTNLAAVGIPAEVVEH